MLKYFYKVATNWRRKKIFFLCSEGIQTTKYFCHYLNETFIGNLYFLPKWHKTNVSPKHFKTLVFLLAIFFSGLNFSKTYLYFRQPSILFPNPMFWILDRCVVCKSIRDIYSIHQNFYMFKKKWHFITDFLNNHFST